MHDQKQMWNKAHNDDSILHYSSNPTGFAIEVIGTINPNSKILELGCGVGNDSIAFANAGHNVLATDFSEVAVEKNKERFMDSQFLNFQVLDMTQPFAFDDNEFDVVYARLSLHYFTDDVTQKIFSEIHRVLKPNGQLFFVCKSTNDPLYGQGVEIEKDMFELEGHIRHFFSEDYARSLLSEGFEIDKLESGIEKFYGSDSGYIKAVAFAVK